MKKYKDKHGNILYKNDKQINRVGIFITAFVLGILFTFIFINLFI